MKIAVTGHTRGIGLAIKTYFENKGHEVIGFSRESGYNLSYPTVKEKLVGLIEDCDIFVNNAYDDRDDFQFSLLKKVHQKWKNTDKIIVNISTRFTNGKDLYSVRKKRMDEFCEENIYTKPTIINIKPGLTDTDRVKSINNPKMTTEDIISILDWILSHNNITIHSITFGK